MRLLCARAGDTEKGPVLHRRERQSLPQLYPVTRPWLVLLILIMGGLQGPEMPGRPLGAAKALALPGARWCGAAPKEEPGQAPRYSWCVLNVHIKQSMDAG